MRYIVCTALLLSLPACTIQQYGRAAPISQVEWDMSCKELKTETVKADAFLSDIQKQRSHVTGRHVLGAALDLGIGNALEGSAAEESAQKRVDSLNAIATEKGC